MLVDCRVSLDLRSDRRSFSIMLSWLEPVVLLPRVGIVVISVTRGYADVLLMKIEQRLSDSASDVSGSFTGYCLRRELGGSQ